MTTDSCAEPPRCFSRRRCVGFEFSSVASTSLAFLENFSDDTSRFVSDWFRMYCSSGAGKFAESGRAMAREAKTARSVTAARQGKKHAHESAHWGSFKAWGSQRLLIESRGKP